MTEEQFDQTEETQESEIDDVQTDVDSPDSENTGEETGAEKPDTFPREYVEKLRDENAKYRQRAQRSDELAQRLHEALVEATGSLQDPTDLAFDESHLDDPEALQQAIDELLAAKPHLAARRPRGDVGQGQTGTSNTLDLAEMLRARA
jgi:hypothetical protein